MKKNRVTAAVLAFMFGGFGIHKFYVRRPGEGFLFIMLTVMSLRIFGLPLATVLGFFDAVRFLMMNDEDFDQKYNRGVQEWGNRRRRSSNRTVRDRHRTQRRNPQRTRNRFEREHKRKPAKKTYAKNNPFKVSGIRKFKEYDINGAIEDFKKAIKMSPNDPAIHFNLACSYSLNEEPKKSFYHLQKSIENGFNDYEKIATHQALAYLRIQEEYEVFKDNGYKFEGALKSQIENSQDGENLLDEDLLLKQLNKLDELRQKGLLSQEEFVEQKKRLMG